MAAIFRREFSSYFTSPIGYIFLTVEELFAKDGVALQPDAAYWRCQDGVTTDN